MDAKFRLGKIVTTRGALRAFRESEEGFLPFLCRHASGDWGELSEDDTRHNDFAVKAGERILSAYKTRMGVKFWIITEADRSATTFLLPSEY